MTFPKCCQVKFSIVVVTCPSTLTLPWQPSFDNHIHPFLYLCDFAKRYPSSLFYIRARGIIVNYIFHLM